MTESFIAEVYDSDDEDKKISGNGHRVMVFDDCSRILVSADLEVQRGTHSVLDAREELQTTSGHEDNIEYYQE